MEPCCTIPEGLEDRPLSRYGTRDDPLRGTPRVLADGGARAAARAARAGRCAGARLPPVCPGMSDARAPLGVSPRQGATVSSRHLLERNPQPGQPRPPAADADPVR